MKRILGGLTAIGFLASIIIANWLTSRFGFIPVGFGQAATAGTFSAGFALALRDGTQDLLGTRWMLATLATGAVLSYLVADPFIALASAVAFGVSELLDFAVYTPLRRRAKAGSWRWAGAVTASGIVGAIADTVIFIGIAFGTAAILPALAGQLIGKGWATVVYLVLGKAASGSVLRESDQLAKGA